MNDRIRRLRYTALAAAAAILLAGCSISLDRLPLPAPGLDESFYTLTATFTNALNLPTKAKVKLNGADVGQVESMTAHDFTALVTMQIRHDVELPVGTTAELRSATPMGDVFVAITPPSTPSPSGGILHDGATIPIEATSAAATIEEVLSRASVLVGGGALENLAHLVAALGEHSADRGERLAALITQTRQLLSSITARSDRIREVVAQANEVSALLAAQRASITDAVTAAGPAVEVIAENTGSILDLVDRVDVIARQLSRFPSIQGTNSGSIIEDIDLLAKGLNDAASNPEADLDALNSILDIVLKLTNGSSAHADIDIVQVAVGAVPDPGFRGTPGGRLPDGGDWTAFVGSLQHMLDRLGGRLNGQPR